MPPDGPTADMALRSADLRSLMEERTSRSRMSVPD